MSEEVIKPTLRNKFLTEESQDNNAFPPSLQGNNAVALPESDGITIDNMRTIGTIEAQTPLNLDEPMQPLRISVHESVNNYGH